MEPDDGVVYTDVEVPILRVTNTETATLVRADGEVLQLTRYTFPDGTMSPLIAHTQAEFSALIRDYQQRERYALDANW